MAIQSVAAETFLTLAELCPVFDVRSPGEYVHAHIPGAHSLPLFSDEERKKIGTAYKQESREIAIKIGLDAFGPKMRRMVEEMEGLIARQYAGVAEYKNTVLVHCWRGGMRSAAVAWLLDLYGFTVYLLEGGYKAYRQWVIGHWQNSGRYRFIGGNTGAGKTKVLKELELMGEPVLDLEGFARHKGSAFGGLDKIAQPSQEMFENLLAEKMQSLRKQFGDTAIWLEDESQRIGDINIPNELQLYWRKNGWPMAFIDVPTEERLENILAEYGHYPIELLINAIVRIKKRLGPLETKTAIAHLVEGDMKSCFRILLHYYDKVYLQYPANETINASGLTAREIALKIKDLFA